MSLQGLRAVITGGAGGIGRACAQHFLNAGAHVVIADTDLFALEQAFQQLGANNTLLHVLACDITQPAQCQKLIEQSVQCLGGPLDIFLAHAGVPFSGSLLEAQEKDIRSVIEVNVLGTIFSAQAALRSLIHGRQPSLLLTGSLQSVMGRADRSVYTASKHAIAGLVKSLSLEMGPLGVRVNGIAPTVIDTPFFRQAIKNMAADAQQSLEKSAKSLPLGRIPNADDFARMAVFLVSDAAINITGQMMMIDAGATAGKFN
ncbi:MAG: SDR family oxidoreductase [Betaproteobacteria bacterium]